MILSEARAALLNPSLESRPQMRWWWFGPDITEHDVDRQLRAMADAGIGGVEVAYVYPLRAGSPTFLGSEFLRVLRFAAERARDLGLRFHLTLGSGWSFGGAHVVPEHAAVGLKWEQRPVQPGPHRMPLGASWPGETVLVAAVMDGEVGMAPAGLQPLPIRDGEIVVPDGRGPRVVVLGIVGPTGQVIKRAAAGADGPVLDHYSAAATRAHLDHVGGALLAAVPVDLVESLFCDSLEVYGANWTPDLPDEFASRRGYAFDDYLHLLIVDLTAEQDPTVRDAAERFRADFYKTLSELYEERFVAECREWCSAHGLPFRMQGYGVPPARLGSYSLADRYEGEGWGWTKLTATRWASSAAHIDGVNVVSSEVWTWVHSPSFRATPLDLRGEAHQHLLAGINELLGHGWPHSPADAEGLGWFFYAAGAIDDRSPWWPVMPTLMRELQRLCAVLRLGRPARDLLLYAPYDDAAKRLGQTADGEQKVDLFRATGEQLPNGLIADIREAGFEFDLFDDTMVDRIDSKDAPVILVAGAHRIPGRTAQWLDAARAAGSTVLSVDSLVEIGKSVARTELVATLRRLVPAASGIEPDPTVGVVRRIGATTDVYAVINTGPRERPFQWVKRGARARTEFWSPEHGTRIEPRNLAPYQALVVIETDEPDPDDLRPHEQTASSGEFDVVALSGRWTATLPDGSTELVQLPHRWEEDPDLRFYSGALAYEIEYELDAGWLADGRAVLLDLGESDPWTAERIETINPPQSYRVHLDPPVGEAAAITINGQEAGIVWAPPYRLDVTALVHEGRNTLRVTVLNTAANALAADDNPRRRAKEVLAPYGLRFEYQDLDRALEDARSGLFGPVRLLLNSGGSSISA